LNFISHRGNILKKDVDLENQPKYIDNAISQNFDVEIDIWLKQNKFYLGHDNPSYLIDLNWLNIRANKLWIHCKNYDSISFFSKNYKNKNFNFFWHNNDDMTLTSLGYLWVYPGKQPIKGSIAVLPEIYEDDISDCIGICSDIILKYRNDIIK
tara:strand:- start:192 stop:650 length:459 start_codon:yes stop_codon:yes gene_type:complete